MPVTDVVDTSLNATKSAAARVKSAAMVRKTVQLLEEIATLYRIYQNGRDLYQSIGRVADNLTKFQTRFRRALDTWSRPITWQGLGSTLNRWGIRGSDDGPLAEVNRTLASYNGDVNRFTRDVNAAPRTFGRDRFIRNVVRGAKVNSAAELDLTDAQVVRVTGDAADHSAAGLEMQLAMDAEIRRQEFEGLQQMEEAMASTDTNMLVSDRQQITLTLRAAEAQVKNADHDASVAMADAIQRKNIAELWAYRRRRATLEAEVTQALQGP